MPMNRAVQDGSSDDAKEISEERGDMPEVITYQEAAAMLGVSHPVVYRMLKGQPVRKFKKRGPRIYLAKVDVEAYIERREREREELHPLDG